MKFSKLIYLLSCWSFSNAETALFMEWKGKQLVEIDKKYASEIFYNSFMSACPASQDSKQELLLNENVSITGNGMFERNYFANPINAKYMETELCENPYSPALVYSTVADSYYVGYELYYKEGKNMESICSGYNYYVKVVDGEIIANQEKPSGTDVKKIQNYGDNCTKFKITSEPQPGPNYIFYWIRVLKVKIFKNEKHRIIEFTADIINDFFNRGKTIHSCKFYYSGDGRKIWNKNRREEDEEVHVQSLDENYFLRGKKTKGESSSRTEKQKKATNRLVKAQIIPMHMFHTTAARLATCMYLNFAFVWETIAKNRLKEIDLFLYAIYREWPLQTSISFGVNGELQYVDPIEWNKIISEDHLFYKFSVPEVVFRIIYFQLFTYPTHGAVIIVHNDLKPVTDANRICSAEEEVNSWDYIKNEDSVTGFSYVCPLTAKVLMKLQTQFYSLIAISKPLKIDEFPLEFDEESQQIRHANVLDRVMRRLEDIKM